MAFFQELQDTLLVEPADPDGYDGDQQASVDQAFEDVIEEEQQHVERSEAEYRTLSAVEARLLKANLYRAVLDNPLFPGESDSIAAEVEQEYREFTLSRLYALMGIADGNPGTDLDAEEKTVIKAWARKLLSKPAVLGLPAPAPEVKTAPVLAPVTVRTQVRPQPQIQAPRVQAQPQVAPPRQPQKKFTAPKKVANPGPRGQEKSEPVSGDDDEYVFKGGKKYVKRDGKDAITGKPKTVLVDVTGFAKPTNVAPVPYPGQQAAMMHEMNLSSMLVPGAIPFWERPCKK